MPEYFIDTNIILRFIVNDIVDQHKKAIDIFEKIEKEKTVGLISILVINELVWVLEKYYEMDRRNYIPEILTILLLKNIKVLEIEKTKLEQILDLFSENKIDLTDIYLYFVSGGENILN